MAAKESVPPTAQAPAAPSAAGTAQIPVEQKDSSARVLGKRAASSAFEEVSSTDHIPKLGAFLRERSDEPETILRVLTSLHEGIADPLIGAADKNELRAALVHHEQARRGEALQITLAWISRRTDALPILEAYAKRRREREALLDTPVVVSTAMISGVRLGPRIGTHAGAVLLRAFGDAQRQLDAFPLPCGNGHEVASACLSARALIQLTG